MQFKFDANQDYQLQAIASVVDLFDGQPPLQADLSAFSFGPLPAVSNRLDLEEADIAANLATVQQGNGLALDSALQYAQATVNSIDGPAPIRFPNFSVEMETGTGKTYVYLRTALELYRRYGMRKFIVVVPSVAIREGVLKTLEITKGHLAALYDNLPYRYYVYDSKSLSQIRAFALSSEPQVMVMTLASFNKAGNVIKQSTDRLQGETPLYLVQSTRPILILDEPQNMESETSIQALASLNPLFALRYSATHRNVYNLVYRLTPFEAYRQGLVKRIEVAGVEDTADTGAPFVRLDSIRSEKRTVRAGLTVHRLMASGAVREHSITVAPGDNLEAKTNHSQYAPLTVDEVNLGAGFIRFTNGLELNLRESTGTDREAVWEGQIRYTLEEHFRKQRRQYPRGIKVLSLFFIDRVDNYRDEGIIRRLFDRCFREVSAQHPDVCRLVWNNDTVDPAAVQGAYFAERRTKQGTLLQDSTSGETERDKEAYDLIMKDKERLLSFAEPKAFIFSHSALREGWDNPNVFQICTLNQTSSEIKKRQEVGRGVRLAVNQDGDRIYGEQVNILTVVANESYQDYVSTLQTEYAEDYALHEQPPTPPRARERTTARLRKAYLLSDEFKGLWERIRQKTRYAVRVDSERLIARVVADLDRTTIQPSRITVTKAQVTLGTEEAFEALQVSGAATLLDLAGRYPLPNLVTLMEELLQRASPPMHVSRKTILEVFRRTILQQAAMSNPHDFARLAAQSIRHNLAQQVADGIRYEKIDDWYEMSQFEAEIETWKDYLVPAEHSLYDQVFVESEPERNFVAGLEARADVKLYVKLPRWFTVDTPVGTYNPDWAIVLEPRDDHGEPTGQQRVYMVRETKDTTDLSQLRPDEAYKIHCGERHFEDALGVDFKVVTSVNELV